MVRRVIPRLTGVSSYGGDRWAIIDREIVQEGDQLPSGHVVGEITNRTVTLILDQEELMLSLGDQQ